MIPLSKKNMLFSLTWRRLIITLGDMDLDNFPLIIASEELDKTLLGKT